MSAALALLAAHAVADFWLQADWMAEKKGDNALVRAEHCAIHVSATLVALLFVAPAGPAALAALAAGGLHFLVDSMGDRRSPPWASPPPDWLPFAHDQTLHLVSLYAVSVLLLG